MEKIAPADPAGKAAWPMDRKRFAAGRARCGEAVLLDSKLSGAEKRVLGICLYKHMHPGEQWSCYASMATLAREAKVCERVCWNAIQKAAAGKYILRHTARRAAGSKYKVTHIAIHPNYLHDHAPPNPWEVGGYISQIIVAFSRRRLGACYDSLVCCLKSTNILRTTERCSGGEHRLATPRCSNIGGKKRR
jgi:hypothetical protein